MIVYQRSPQYTYNRDGYASAKPVTFSVSQNNSNTHNLFDNAHADKHFMVVDASGNMSTIPISQANTSISQLDNARRDLRAGITNFANQFAGITIDTNGNFTTTGSITSGGNITTTGGNITTGTGNITSTTGQISTNGRMICGELSSSGNITYPETIARPLNEFLTSVPATYQTQTQNDARYVQKNQYYRINKSQNEEYLHGWNDHSVDTAAVGEYTHTFMPNNGNYQWRISDIP